MSNPFSSGGGGTTFEMAVAACYLVSLLREEIPRGLSGGITSRIRFQARQLGVPLDDLLITSYDGQIQRHVALQIKHKLTFSAHDQTFQAVISAAWATYTSREGWQFSVGRDRLGLALGVITGPIREHLLPLLEWARSYLSAREFLNAVNTSHYSDEQKRTYLTAFGTTLRVAAGRPLTDDELWLFLRHLVVLDFDLESEGCRDATIAWNHLLDEIPGRDTAVARTVFHLFIAEAASLAPRAGTINLEELREKVGSLILLRLQRSLEPDLHCLADHSELVLHGIRDDLAGQLYLPRTSLLEATWNALEAAPVTCILGEPGSGKSGVLRSVARQLANEGQVLLLRVGELDYPTLSGFLRDLGVRHAIHEVLEGLSGTPRRFLLLDGLERLLTLRHKNVLNDLLGAIARQNDSLRACGIPEQHHWKILCTCRTYALQDALSELPVLNQVTGQQQMRMITTDLLTEQEIQEVTAVFASVQTLWQDEHLRELLRRPLYQDILTRQKLALQRPSPQHTATEAWFAEEFWHYIVRRASVGQEGLGEPLARSQTMLKIAQQLLTMRRSWVPIQDLDPQALQGLILDMVLREEDERVTFAHDVFEDWAYYKLLAQSREQIVALIEQYQEPRSFDHPLQLFACRLLEESPSVQEWQQLLRVLEMQAHTSPRWHDIALTAPLFSPCLPEIVPRIETVLLAENGRKLAQMLVALRSVATAPDPTLNLLFQDSEQEERDKHAPYMRVPVEQIWVPFLHLLLRLGDGTPSDALLPASEVMKMWMQKTPVDAPLRKEVASLALHRSLPRRRTSDE